ncbi:MAG TPA: NAD-dependent epimerase/dehydratase family protein, partial [Acidimicrobiia bacterium]
MVAIAVTGASGLVGQRLLPRLADEAQVTRLIGLDVRDPRRRVRNLTFHRVDIGGAELKPLLEAAEVLVHLATVVDPVPDEAVMARVNVEGTRRVLDAAAAVGVRKVIRVSTAAVYGAWPNNPVPLTEDATLRPNPGFAPAVHAAEVERLLAEWREEHPAVTVTTLRSAPVLGAGAERLPSRLLLGRPPLRVRGAGPPVQVVHVDDLVDALLLAVGNDLPGTYNVAADGWLGSDDAQALLPRSLLPPLPAELLERIL